MAGRFGPATRTATVTIANGATTSDAVDLGPYRLGAIEVPASMTGTAITFTASATFGGTYVAVHKDDNTAYSVTCDTNARILVLDTAAPVFAALRFVKLVSGSAETGAKVITLHLTQ